MQLSRRDALKLGLLGSAALLLPLERVARTQLAQAARLPADRLPLPFTRAFVAPPVMRPITKTLKDGRVVDFYDLVQRQVSLPILGAGYPPTTVWGYNGMVPGPTIQVNKGREVVFCQSNDLPDRHPTLGYQPRTSTHLHGSASLPQFDGYASDVTARGESKYYLYPDFQEARTLWYHDHGVHQTAQNAYMGLAAQYHLFDPHERSLPLPKGGRYDVPLIIRDAIFGTDGSLIYDDNDESSLMGDVVLVNGVPWPRMAVERRKYRFRVLNASLGRSYRLALSTKGPMMVIATDGGLMPAPQTVADMRLGQAERYEVVIDFAEYKVGQRIVLRNLGLKNNVAYPSTTNIMAFDVVGEATDGANNEVPSSLFQHPTMALTDGPGVAKRRLEFRRQHGHWTVNGRTWEDVVRSRFREVVAKVPVGAVEVWELVNASGGWFHPVHIHLIDFKILDRNGRPPFPYEMGPKDTAYVGENETVRVIARFGPQQGRYMIHCHNLVHEDHDMMVQYAVGDAGFDPVEAARPEPTATIPRVEDYARFPPDVPGQ